MHVSKLRWKMLCHFVVHANMSAICSETYKKLRYTSICINAAYLIRTVLHGWLIDWFDYAY